MQKMKDLRKNETKKLNELLEKVRKELIEKKFEVSMSKEKNVSVIKKLKKQIAQIKTVLVEKEIINE